MATGMRIGYARVSSSGQRPDVQLDRLADCDRVFREKVSGKSTKGRPQKDTGTRDTFRVN
ncbi:recombinase family protein [Desulfuromonas carbonis]